MAAVVRIERPERRGRGQGWLALVALGPVVAVAMFLAELPLADLVSSTQVGRDADGHYARWMAIALPVVMFGIPLFAGGAVSAWGLRGLTGLTFAVRLLLGLVITLAGGLLIALLLWTLGVNVQRSSY